MYRLWQLLHLSSVVGPRYIKVANAIIVLPLHTRIHTRHLRTFINFRSSCRLYLFLYIPHARCAYTFLWTSCAIGKTYQIMCILGNIEDLSSGWATQRILTWSCLLTLLCWEREHNICWLWYQSLIIIIIVLYQPIIYYACSPFFFFIQCYA